MKTQFTIYFLQIYCQERLSNRELIASLFLFIHHVYNIIFIPCCIGTFIKKKKMEWNGKKINTHSGSGFENLRDDKMMIFRKS
jgi:hypothetical protein